MGVVVAPKTREKVLPERSVGREGREALYRSFTYVALVRGTPLSSNA